MTNSHESLQDNLEHILAAARPRLERIVRTQGVTCDAVDDVVQETMLEAWRHLERLHTPQGIEAWLNKICYHICLRWSRSQSLTASRQTSLSTVFQEEAGNPLEMDIPDPLAFDPAEELTHQDLANLLDRAMSYLPKSTREAIELYYLVELPQSEAALRLGLTINALEVRLHRARQQLRQVLSGELRSDAEEFGLTLDQEVALGWRETREWCNLCGQLRLRGLFEPQPGGRINLRLRCPNCSPVYNDMFNSGLKPPRIFHSFRSAYKHAWRAASAFWTEALETRQQHCSNCKQSLVKLQIVHPDEYAFSTPYPNIYRMILDCPICGIMSTCSVAAFLVHPSILRFIEQHPRWIIGPEAASEYNGQPAIRTSLIDTTSAAQLTVLANRQNLQTLATFEQ
jgi:RNA polymerase sigma-70 factor (ECF subfamily)